MTDASRRDAYTVEEVICLGQGVYQDWYSDDGIEDTHARELVQLAYTVMASNAAGLKAGTIVNDGDLACRWAQAMFCAFQMGRAAAVTSAALGDSNGLG